MRKMYNMSPEERAKLWARAEEKADQLVKWRAGADEYQNDLVVDITQHEAARAKAACNVYVNLVSDKFEMPPPKSKK